MCIADILRDFKEIYEKGSEQENRKVKPSGWFTGGTYGKMDICIDLKEFMEIAAAKGGGKRARVRRTKRTKGKSRGRAGKATRVRRNNNNNSNNNAKTKRNKGKKRRTKRA